MGDFKKAVDEKVVGLGNKLSYKQQWEMAYLGQVINVLRSGSCLGKPYLYALPTNFVEKFVTGKCFYNVNGSIVSIDKCIFVSEKTDYILHVHNTMSNKRWRMWLSTVISDGCMFIGVQSYIQKKYFRTLDLYYSQDRMTKLLQKKASYDNWYKSDIRNSNTVINKTVNRQSSDVKVTRDAVRKSIRSIQQDSKVIADAWNSTLSKQEQDALIKWLASNIYSMRLYTVKDSRWDKAICELYPEETYGKHRQTEASELSKDSINGYISLSNIKDIPYNILKKITHKEKESDIIKQNKGSSKFRINNYLLVLYLLNNYNKNGFKLGKTGLNKDIKL